MHVEKNTDDGWEVVTPWFKCEMCQYKRDDEDHCSWCKGSGMESNFDDRNYNLFAMLADVRNGRGTAGIDTGDGFVPISEPRGLPRDAAEYPTGDHSGSWLMLTELLAYDLTRTTARRVSIDVKDYKGYKGGRPECETFGRRWATGERSVTSDAYDAGDTEGVTTVQVEWRETYVDAGGRFWRDFVPALQKLGKPHEIRIVFNFDS